jgi:hypothetical protein
MHDPAAGCLLRAAGGRIHLPFSVDRLLLAS